VDRKPAPPQQCLEVHNRHPDHATILSTPRSQTSPRTIHRLRHNSSRTPVQLPISLHPLRLKYSITPYPVNLKRPIRMAVGTISTMVSIQARRNGRVIMPQQDNIINRSRRLSGLPCRPVG
jgi:hypothetical protein